MDGRLPRKPVARDVIHTRQNKKQREEDEEVQVQVFGKRVAWIWIVMGLILLLGLVTFLYVTYTRHRRRVQKMAKRLELEDAHNTPTCRVPIHTRASIAGEVDAERMAILQEMNSMPLRCTNAFRNRRSGTLIKPEDEWRAKAGIEWLQAKKQKLVQNANKIATSKPKHKQKRDAKAEEYNAMSYQLDSPLFVQNWTGIAGVFDIFEQIEATRCAYRNGSCPVLPPPVDLQLPFDVDYAKFCRRLDAQYNHKAWWK